jgi:hypothetical protein
MKIALSPASSPAAPAAHQPAPTPKADQNASGTGQTGGELNRPREGPSAIQSAREEDGKVIIETRLHGSNARALWVVDGGFQVAGNSITKEGQL